MSSVMSDGGSPKSSRTCSINSPLLTTIVCTSPIFAGTVNSNSHVCLSHKLSTQGVHILAES